MASQPGEIGFQRYKDLYAQTGDEDLATMWHGRDVNKSFVTDDLGDTTTTTPLIYAVRIDSPGFLRTVLERHPNTKQPDADGKTALDYLEPNDPMRAMIEEYQTVEEQKRSVRKAGKRKTHKKKSKSRRRLYTRRR